MKYINMTYTHTHTTKYRKIQVKKITKRDENRTFVLFSFKFDTIVSRSRFITVSLPPSIYLPIPRYSSVQSSKIVNPRLPFNFSSISQQFKGEIVNRAGGGEPRKDKSRAPPLGAISSYTHNYRDSVVVTRIKWTNPIECWLRAEGGDRPLSEISLLDIVGCSSR